MSVCRFCNQSKRELGQKSYCGQCEYFGLFALQPRYSFHSSSGVLELGLLEYISAFWRNTVSPSAETLVVKLETVCLFGTLKSVGESTWCQKAPEREHTQRCENLKSHMGTLFLSKRRIYLQANVPLQP